MEITTSQTVLFLLLMIMSFVIFTVITANSVQHICNLYDTLIKLEKKDRTTTKIALWEYFVIFLVSVTILMWIIHTIISMLITVLRV